MTYNQAVKRIETISLAHKQVRFFKRGLTQDFLTDKTNLYSAIFLQDGGGSIDPGEHSTSFIFRLWFLDLVHVSEDAKTNELDVLSDEFSIAMDIVAQMNFPGYNDWAISYTNATQAVVENDGDMNAGWYIDMRIRFPWDQNVCEVPSDADIIPPTSGLIYWGVQDSNADPIDFSHSTNQDPELAIIINYGVQGDPKFFWLAVPATATNKEDWVDMNGPGNNGSIGALTDLFEIRAMVISGVNYTLYMTRYLTGFNATENIVKFTI